VTRLAVEDDGHPVGFTIVGPCEDPEAKGLRQVYVLNVHPRAWGRGKGRALLSPGEDALKRAGFAEAVLWVHPQNGRARRFYESAGWHPDGPVRHEQILGLETPEVRYRRSLDLSRRT
jgi:GNAT superfamily N-acetyltransferase